MRLHPDIRSSRVWRCGLVELSQLLPRVLTINSFHQGFEREIAEAANEEQKNESLMRLSWALVHSRQPEDVNRGIGMLEGDIHILISNSFNSWSFLL